MRTRIALIAVTLAVAATPGIATAQSSTVKFTVASGGVSCVMRPASVSCQGVSSSRTVAATLFPSGQSATCDRALGAPASCLKWPGASYGNAFLRQPELKVDLFTCIPLGLWTQPKGAVCTVAKSGVGFRIGPGKVAKINQIPPGPHPPCTRAALTNALERAYHKRSLAPSFLTKGWQCGGNYARGDYIDMHNGQGDDITVVFRGKGRQWTLVGRGQVCEDGELPAAIYVACTVN
jgi:hypothetical protein